MTVTHVTCTHTRGNRTQECVLVLAADRMACLPIAPARNAVGSIAGGLAMAAAGLVTVRFGGRELAVDQLATAAELDAAVDGSGGFYLDAAWTYRTGIPVIGTMLVHGGDVITTRERVPAELLARVTPAPAVRSTRAVKVVCGIGAAILAAAVVVYLATGSLEALFGIGCWGVLVIAAGVYAWRKVAAGPRPGGAPAPDDQRGVPSTPP